MEQPQRGLRNEKETLKKNLIDFSLWRQGNYAAYYLLHIFFSFFSQLEAWKFTLQIHQQILLCRLKVDYLQCQKFHLNFYTSLENFR